MKTKLLALFTVLLITASCSKKPKRIIDSPQQGTITVAADDSFRSVSQALVDRYMALYPNTKINLTFKKEDLAFLDLLERKVRVIVMSRELNDREKKAFKDKLDMELQPARFAADAVVFVVAKSSLRDSISVKEIESMLSSESKPIIFDGTNSSNLNFVAQKFNEKPEALKYSIISGNRNIVDQLQDFPDKIGAVSFNTLSRPYDPESIRLREGVKVLRVSEGNKSYEPTVQNLADMSYPFSRVLYFLTNEPYFGLGNGLIRFSCTQLGQIVVAKEGLQPYNIFRREVQMR